MLSFECIKNEKSVYFLLTSAAGCYLGEVSDSIRGVVEAFTVFHRFSHFPVRYLQ